MNQYRVIKSHQSEPGIHVDLKKGDNVTVERRKTKWDGWLWCTTKDGRTGWVPESWIDLSGNQGIMKQDYNSYELRVEPGEVLQGILIESNWLLALTSDDTTGWVPLECLGKSF
ncbi:MAG: SH3 domain-containing protein [bacterium]